MAITINGTGTISGLSATGISAQPVFPGNILQVVSANYTTYTTSSSSTYADTGLTASITPSATSSKVLVFVHHGGCSKTVGNTFLGLKLLRGSTSLCNFEQYGGYNGTTTFNGFGSCSTLYLDSPSSTSSVTYKTQFASASNVARVAINDYASPFIADTISTITLFEVAG